MSGFNGLGADTQTQTHTDFDSWTKQFQETRHAPGTCVGLKCYDNQYQRDIFSIVISPAHVQYNRQYHNYHDIYCS